MIKAWPAKDPNANLRYYFDWTAFVAAESSAITSFDVALDAPPDAALIIGVTALNASQVMAWISGGTEGETYVVRCRVTLADGTVEDESRSITISSH